MNGLRGMPFSCSSWTSELYGLPDGSRPTRLQRLAPSEAMTNASANTLVTLCAENCTSHAPTPVTLPSRSATAMPNWFGSTVPSAGMWVATWPRPISGSMSASTCVRMLR